VRSATNDIVDLITVLVLQIMNQSRRIVDFRRKIKEDQRSVILEMTRH